jgi:thiol-disulfide isomerase/thioredoxin
MIRPMIQRKYIVPKNKKEWGSLGSDLFSLAAGVFLLFILQKNYAAPMDAVMQYKSKALPAFQFRNLGTNADESLQQYADKIVILNIWATWCPPCRAEMPELDELQQKYPEKLRVLAISDESQDIINKFLSTHPFGFTTGSFTSSNALLESINSRPVSILVVKGKVEDIVVGARGFSFFSDWVLPYMEE